MTSYFLCSDFVRTPIGFPELIKFKKQKIIKVGKLVGKIAAYYYGLDCGRSGKLSRESDSLETFSREKDVAPKFGFTSSQKSAFHGLSERPKSVKAGYETG